MAKAAKIKVLSFSADDKPELQAAITGALVSAKVNILSVCSYSVEDTAYIDIATDSNTNAKKALAKIGIKSEEDDAILVEMSNKPGELDKIGKALAGAGINVEYIYGTTSSGRTSTCVMGASDNRKALRILAKA